MKMELSKISDSELISELKRRRNNGSKIYKKEIEQKLNHYKHNCEILRLEINTSNVNDYFLYKKDFETVESFYIEKNKTKHIVVQAIQEGGEGEILVNEWNHDEDDWI